MNAPGFRWDHSAQTVLADALRRLGPHRCIVNARLDELVLSELLTSARQDRIGTSRLLECGAALSSAWTVMRVLGQQPVVTFPRDPDRPDVVAVVRSNGTRTAASGEWARYVALRKVGEPPLGTVLRPVSLAVLSALAGDNFWPGTAVRIVRPEWSPTLKQLGADPTGQSALLVTTTGDTRREHVLAGAALHGARLSAAVRGFATRVVPMAASERARYLEESLLPGIPQGLVLVGLRTPKRKRT